ncbi:MAG: transposase [Anaerolineales bacterium]|nr:transposase [Anaerolineales bacterium]
MKNNTDSFGRKPDLFRNRCGEIAASERNTALSCYEAGRDGFWIHCCLERAGYHNLVVGSSSNKVSRRARRRKTDTLDVNKLLAMLIRYHSGELKLWQVVHVPSEEIEEARHLHRELMTLKSERTRHNNRIKGLLITQGIPISVNSDFRDRLESVRRWDGYYCFLHKYLNFDPIKYLFEEGRYSFCSGVIHTQFTKVG